MSKIKEQIFKDEQIKNENLDFMYREEEYSRDEAIADEDHTKQSRAEDYESRWMSQY